MTYEIVNKPTHGSQEWLDLRHRDKRGKVRFGASEAPVIMGASKYKTVTDLALEKWTTPEPLAPSDAMTRGNVLEPSLVEWGATLIGQPVTTPDVMYVCERMIATLDGLSADGKIIIEAKTTTAHSSDDPCPTEYFWQATAQLACVPDAEQVIVVVLDKRMRLGHWVVPRNQRDIDTLLTEAAIIGDYLDRKELPPESPVTEDNVKKLWPQPEGEIELDAAARGAFMEWQGWKIARENAEKQEQAARDILTAKLGAHAVGTIDGVAVVSYKSRKGNSTVDWKAVAADHPLLLDKYRKQNAATRILKSLTTGREDV